MKHREVENPNQAPWRRKYRYVRQRVPGYGAINWVPMSKDAPIDGAARRAYFLLVGIILLIGMALIIWAINNPG